MKHDKTLAVAHYMLHKGASTKTQLTNKLLQKLMYYAQAWHLVFNNGKPLFDDAIEAWVHGPAIPRVYRHFNKFGYLPITTIADSEKMAILSPKEKSHLHDVWTAYGVFDADYLEALTHREAPWQRARKNLQPYQSSNALISLKSMQNYYAKRLKESQKASASN